MFGSYQSSEKKKKGNTIVGSENLKKSKLLLFIVNKISAIYNKVHSCTANNEYRETLQFNYTAQ